MVAMQSLPFKPGAYLDVRVEHDDHCPVMRGQSKCHCSPNIYINANDQSYEVLPDGCTRRLEGSNPK